MAFLHLSLSPGTANINPVRGWQRPAGEEGLCLEPPADGRVVAAAPRGRAAAVPDRLRTVTIVVKS